MSRMTHLYNAGISGDTVFPFITIDKVINVSLCRVQTIGSHVMLLLKIRRTGASLNR